MSDKCTCPCIDCIAGNHCGGEYYIDETGELIGVCNHPDAIIRSMFCDNFLEADHDDCIDDSEEM